MFVAAFDLATVTGCAHGYVNAVPLVWTWDLRDAGPDFNDRITHFRKFTDTYFEAHAVDQLWYERPMAVATAVHIGSNDSAVRMALGLAAILVSSARLAGVREIHTVTTQAARQHFVGQARFKKPGEGKQRVFEKCQQIQWPVENLDEADACAVYFYAISQINPGVAHKTTPLFLNPKSPGDFAGEN